MLAARGDQVILREMNLQQAFLAGYRQNDSIELAGLEVAELGRT